MMMMTYRYGAMAVRKFTEGGHKTACEVHDLRVLKNEYSVGVAGACL